MQRMYQFGSSELCVVDVTAKLGMGKSWTAGLSAQAAQSMRLIRRMQRLIAAEERIYVTAVRRPSRSPRGATNRGDDCKAVGLLAKPDFRFR